MSGPRPEESVADYPRPPRVEAVPWRVVVTFGGIDVADSTDTVRICETYHPPVYYIPPADVRIDLLRPAGGGSWCEWKGTAAYWDVVVGDRTAPRAAWSYPEPTGRYEALRDHVAFYAGRVDACRVDGDPVVPQPGDFYGGWITPEITGPIKGAPGTRGLVAVGAFTERLAASTTPDAPDRWLYVPYDQLTLDVGPLASAPPGSVGVVLVESRWKAGRRPYHKQKLALVLANQRHFALEATAAGVPVRYLAGPASPAAQLRPMAREVGPLACMRPAERELREDLTPLVDDGLLSWVPHEGWLTTEEDFEAAGPDDGPWRMDAFYRAVRARTGILMDGDGPVGGRYSFDGDNRKPWPGDPPAPEPPRFEPDAVTREVGAMVERRFTHHPGSVDLAALPATAADADALWAWARAECLTSFGPFEDAMSARSAGLFHTRVSPLLNLHRLLPARVVDDVVAMDVPLQSKEGFVRQVLGWREFVRHVHERTDGFRRLPGRPEPPTSAHPGDGGFGAWRGRAWSPSDGPDGGAAPSALGADGPLPPAWWGRSSGLACLDTVVDQVLDTGWTHHIPRLMVLANLATLLDVSPRALTDWFWVAFVDAFDWVVEPNVLAMGTFGAGPVMTTKPYVSGAAYIHRMSDYCGECAFDPKGDCPVTNLYWAFLGRHRPALDGTRRMALPLASEAKRSDRTKARDAAVFRRVREALAEGRRLTPEALAAD